MAWCWCAHGPPTFMSSLNIKTKLFAMLSSFRKYLNFGDNRLPLFQRAAVCFNLVFVWNLIHLSSFVENFFNGRKLLIYSSFSCSCWEIQLFLYTKYDESGFLLSSSSSTTQILSARVSTPFAINFIVISVPETLMRLFMSRRLHGGSIINRTLRDSASAFYSLN